MLRRKTSATSIGTPVSATADLTVHLDTRRTPLHNLATPTLSIALETGKTLRMQLWNFLQWTT